MQVHPAVARLRGDGAPQPGCDAALAAWRGSPMVADVRAALARFDAGEPLGDLPALARIIADHAAAQAFVAGFIAPLTGALRAEPLAQLPIGHSARRAWHGCDWRNMGGRVYRWWHLRSAHSPARLRPCLKTARCTRSWWRAKGARCCTGWMMGGSGRRNWRLIPARGWCAMARMPRGRLSRSPARC